MEYSSHGNCWYHWARKHRPLLFFGNIFSRGCFCSSSIMSWGKEHDSFGNWWEDDVQGLLVGAVDERMTNLSIIIDERRKMKEGRQHCSAGLTSVLYNVQKSFVLTRGVFAEKQENFIVSRESGPDRRHTTPSHACGNSHTISDMTPHADRNALRK